jgi:hypothetical protein
MTVFLNTMQTTAAVGNRQELSDIVDRITPEDTPIYSMIGRRSVKSTHPEWEIDSLRAPAANAQLEGDEYAFGAHVAPLRVGNYTQILREGWIVSNTQEAVDNAGNVEKYAEKKVKAGIVVRKDVELSIVTNAASVAGATRVSGGLPTWLTTNASRGATGASGGFVGSVTTVEGLGTQRAFTKTLMDTVMGLVYNSGGDANDLVVSPYVKSVFVTFMSDTNVAAFRTTVDTGTNGRNVLMGDVDIYDGPFGRVTVKPNRVMATSAAVARRAFFIDREKLKWGWLRPIHEDPDIAKTGDAKKGMIIGEGCLIVTNEAAHGVVADVFGLTAAT